VAQVVGHVLDADRLGENLLNVDFLRKNQTF
jgi:hypothetical protein